MADAPNQQDIVQPLPGVLPVINAITQGNSDATAAATEGAAKGQTQTFGDIGQLIGQVSAQMQNVFKAGVAQGSGATSSGNSSGSGGSPAASAAQATTAAQGQSQALQTQGGAQARIDLNKATADKAAAVAVKQDAIRLALDPNNPEAIAAMQTVREGAANVQATSKQLQDMSKVGFFDNPAAFLINHVINIPISQQRLEEQTEALGASTAAIADQTKTLQNRALVDQAMNSADLTSNLADTYAATFNKFLSDSAEPILKAAQIQLSAYSVQTQQAEVAIGEQRVGIEAQSLALQKFKAPFEIAETMARTNAYTQQASATAQLRAQEQLKLMQEKGQQEDTLKDINSTFKYFGLPGGVTDLKQIPQEKLKPLLEMTYGIKNTLQIASDPATAYRLLKESGIPLSNIPDSQLPTIDALGRTYTEAVEGIRQKYASNPSLGAMPKGQELDDMVRQAVYDKISSYQTDIKAGQPFYSMPSLNGLLERPWAANNPILSATKPLTVDGSGNSIKRDADGNLFINTANSLIKKGTLTESQAVDALRDIGYNTKKDIQTAGGFGRYAIPFDSSSFNVTIKKNGLNLTGDHIPVNLMDSASVLRALRIQRSAFGEGIVNTVRNPTTQTTPAVPKKLGKYSGMPPLSLSDLFGKPASKTTEPKLPYDSGNIVPQLPTQ